MKSPFTQSILGQLAQDDEEVISKVLEARDVCIDVDNEETPYVSKSHRKKIKTRSSNVTYNTSFKGVPSHHSK